MVQKYKKDSQFHHESSKNSGKPLLPISDECRTFVPIYHLFINYINSMKTFFTRTLALLAAMTAALGTQAYDFQADNIYYTISDKSANFVSVVSGDNKYAGDITIPTTVTNEEVVYTVTGIGNGAFQNCGGLFSVTLNNRIRVIPENAFRSCSNLEKVVLGSKVEEIGYCAFTDCVNLEDINLNDRITTFGYSAFSGCTSLTSVVIGESVLTMDGSVFSGCTNIKTVDIHDGATVIGGSAFYGCKKLQTITIPKSVLTIGNNAFQNCTSLTSAVIGDGVKAIPENAFRNCTNLEKVTLGAKVEVIGYCSFSDCTALADINLNDNITTFANSAFSGCTSLTSVLLGESVLSMDGNVFSGCTNIKTVEIHDGAAVIGGSAFYGCTKLQTVDVPNSVLAIGNSAFQNCSSLTTIKIGDGVQTISENMLRNCSRLQTVILGSGVRTVGYASLADCSQLKSLTVMSPEVPAVNNNSFANYNATLYVPQQSVADYLAHDIWKKFAKVEAFEGTVYLTIRQAEQGSVRQAVNLGEPYRLSILPEEGWNVHSVTFNGTDVTGQLVDNTYTTPALTVNSVIAIVFGQGDSAVRSIDANPVKIQSDEQGNIMVSNMNAGESLTVYDTNGKLVQQVTADGHTLRMNIGTRGIYLVRAGKQTFKLAL